MLEFLGRDQAEVFKRKMKIGGKEEKKRKEKDKKVVIIITQDVKLYSPEEDLFQGNIHLKLGQTTPPYYSPLSW